VPEISCLFGAATPPLLRELSGEPICASRLHRLTTCQGLELSGDGLAVVFLSGAVRLPWSLPPEPRPKDRPLVARALAAGMGRSWLEEALPPPPLMDTWAGIAQRVRQPLGWWWWHERGDSLYSDAAWVAAPDGELLAVRETPLSSGKATDEGRVYGEDQHGSVAVVELADAPLRLVMEALGFRSALQYFAPTDDWHFDWAPHRVG